MLKDSNYLDVTYSEKIAPKGHYPHLLGKWLKDNFLDGGKEIIDFGCGRGDYLEVFENLGFKV